jgi:hypothetical protein
MSSDFINPIGGKTPRLNQANQVAPKRPVEAPPKAETGNNVAGQAPTGGFQPTSEAKESRSEENAGAAAAAKFAEAWSPGQADQGASAGQLVVGGASNTSVNQVHGTSQGAYQPSNAAKPGFTEATTYSSQRPLG